MSAPLMRNGQPNPTGTGRYCLRVCYCGDCPHYEPLPEVSALLVPMVSTAQQASSWANRDEPTWLDG